MTASRSTLGHPAIVDTDKGATDADLDIDARTEQGEDAPQRLWRVMQDQAKVRMRLHESYQLARARDVDET